MLRGISGLLSAEDDGAVFDADRVAALQREFGRLLVRQDAGRGLGYRSDGVASAGAVVDPAGPMRVDRRVSRMGQVSLGRTHVCGLGAYAGQRMAVYRVESDFYLITESGAKIPITRVGMTAEEFAGLSGVRNAVGVLAAPALVNSELPMITDRKVRPNGVVNVAGCGSAIGWSGRLSVGKRSVGRRYAGQVVLVRLDEAGLHVIVEVDGAPRTVRTVDW